MHHSATLSLLRHISTQRLKPNMERHQNTENPVIAPLQALAKSLAEGRLVSPDDLAELLPVLDSGDRENLLRRRKAGEISQQEFSEDMGKLALEVFLRRFQQHDPELEYPKLDDAEFDLAGYLRKVDTAMTTERSEFHKTVPRVQQEAPILVRGIFSDWERLTTIADTHSHSINKRWTKRTVEKRKTLLLEAWPGMCPMHRPDFDVIRRKATGPVHRDALMMPYVNLEDLSSPKNLLSLIGCRTSKAPEHFAWSDSLFFETASKLKAVKPAALFETVMLLTGQKTQASYGTLLALKNNTEVLDLIGTGFGFRMDHGLTVLETQRTLYRFLLRCTELLLHDMDLSTTSLSTEQTHSLIGLVIPPDSKEWRSVSDMNAEIVYNLPQPFSIQSIRRLANAKRDEAEDSFWAVHEDPAYFQQQLELHEERNMEPFRRGIRETSFHGVKKAERHAIAKAWKDVVRHSCRDIIIWDMIIVKLTELEHERADLHTEIELSKRLPLSYEKILERFIGLMFMVWKFSVKEMYRVLISSADFNDFFEVLDISGSRLGFRPNKSIKDRWPPVLTLISDLYELETTYMMGALNILDELERLMTTDMTQRALISTEMAKEISRLAALAQIQDALVRHQPTVQGSQEPGPILTSYWVRLYKIEELEEAMNKMPLVDYVKPRSAFNYPIGKKRSQQNVEQMRLAESKLDKFWDQLDKAFVADTGRTLQQWAGISLEHRDIQRTQPWDPSEEQLPNRKTASLTQEQYRFGSETVSSVAAAPTLVSKIKQKTKGEADPSRGTSTVELVTISEGPTQAIQTFALPARAFKTISAVSASRASFSPSS